MKHIEIDPDFIDVHYEALWKLPSPDREIGRLPCLDYVHDFYQLAGLRLLPQLPGVESILNQCPTVGSDPDTLRYLESAYALNGISVPIGIEDLPVWWGRVIADHILAADWQEDDPVNVNAVYEWTVVLRQGPCLEVHFPYSLPPRNRKVHWCEIGAVILHLNQLLEPGLFTSQSRLSEYSLGRNRFPR